MALLCNRKELSLVCWGDKQVKSSWDHTSTYLSLKYIKVASSDISLNTCGVNYVRTSFLSSFSGSHINLPISATSTRRRQKSSDISANNSGNIVDDGNKASKESSSVVINIWGNHDDGRTHKFFRCLRTSFSWKRKNTFSMWILMNGTDPYSPEHTELLITHEHEVIY